MMAIACMALVSCGNMSQVMSAMTNGTGIANAIKSVIGLDKVKQQNLIGEWKYKGPGCAFMSENLLAKAGGEMAAVQIEEKLLPYYQQVYVFLKNRRHPIQRQIHFRRGEPEDHTEGPISECQLLCQKRTWRNLHTIRGQQTANRASDDVGHERQQGSADDR